jgi:GDP-L-fucose synthase
MAFDLAGKRVWVAGHRGMVGGALVRRLARERCRMATQRPEVVVIAAAKVGGILANDSQPVAFLNENLLIQSNIIANAHRVGVQKLLFLGSSCIYPRDATQPIGEDSLLTGPLEPTNQWYAVAKIAGIKLCQAYRRQHGCDFISAMPTNLYGPGDNFDLATSHVLPALLVKAHRAKQSGAASIELWGTGTPMREFLYVEDLADACVFLLRHYSEEGHINVGFGADLSIRALTELVAEVVGFAGRFTFDPTKPDGTPRKLMDSARLRALGWRPTTDLRTGIAQTYAWYLAHTAA